MKCRICHKEDFDLILDLGHHPPSDAFLTESQLDEPEILYPLKVYKCKVCELVQLGYVVPSNVLYQNKYPYQTGNNSEGVKHFHDMARSIVRRYDIDRHDFLVDVGGNDGTFLDGFKDVGCELVNVDPSGVVKYCDHRTIDVWNTFFTTEVARNIKYIYGSAKVITATNVFAHVDDIHEFMKAINILLSDDGVFIIEVPRLDNLVKNVCYDTIYHEHLSYFNHTPLVFLFDEYKMGVDGIEYFYDIHGGTVRYHIKHGPGDYLRDDEIDFSQFKNLVERNRGLLKDTLGYLKLKGAKIGGVSAPAKGNTILNYCKIGTETIDFITEKSERKIGKFTPGMHIPVVDESILAESKPDYLVLFAWNWQEQLMDRCDQLGYRGKYIIPIPEPRIIEHPYKPFKGYFYGHAE